MVSRDNAKTKRQLVADVQRLEAELATARRSVNRGGHDVEALIHDLEVHQEELRMSNVQLIEAQRALEESRDRYADLFDFAPVSYITLDGSGVIREINLTGAAMLGSERAYLLGVPMLTYIVAEDRRQFLAHLNRCRSAQGAVLTELRIRPRGQQPVIPAQLTTRRSDNSGQMVYYTAITDLSERIRSQAERERLLLQQQAAKAADEAKDRFLAVLSHELRTPLTPVLAAASVLNVDGTSDDEVRSLAEMIRRNVELEARLIDDLLDVSRIRQGKLRLRREAVGIDQVIRDVQDICAAELAAKQLKCEVELRAPNHCVHGDTTRLHQVLWNLLHNAIKFSPAGGTIHIRTEAAVEAAKHIAISVRDEGIGIEPQAQDRIFGPFEQVAIGNKTAGGLGLGLYIVRSLIEAHGGQISVNSPGEGRGATFRIVLATVPQAAARSQPAASPHEECEPPAYQWRQPGPVNHKPAPSPANRPARILLVEDHPDTAQLMARLLTREGHELRIAHSVTEAMREVSEETNLLISDLGLPDGSGLDLMRQLRSQRPLRGIALSGYGSDEDLRRSREAGFDEHLTKPIAFDQLLAAIDRVVGAAAAT